MTTALFISPHLDDAVFSCGGTMARLAGFGWRVVVATVFTATMPDPQGFALACQTDKGIPAGEDYMALRRAEDEAAVRSLGAEAIWLGHPEAPHRGYESAGALFAGVRATDTVDVEASRDLAEIIQGLSPALVFAPQGLGGHVDHAQVLLALEAGGGLTELRERQLRRRLLYYRDTPYAIREPGSAPEPGRLPATSEVGAGIGRGLAAKLEACGSYTSQLGFQFGGEETMRAKLTGFAVSEGERLRLGEPAESYLSSFASPP